MGKPGNEKKQPGTQIAERRKKKQHYIDMPTHQVELHASVGHSVLVHQRQSNRGPARQA